MKLKKYIKAQYLSVPKFIIENAVKNFGDDYLSALSLLRGALQDKDGAFASLKDAQEVYVSITGRTPWKRD